MLCGGGGAGDERRRDRGRPRLGARRRATGRGDRALLRGDEGSGQGQAEALRTLLAVRARAVLRDDRGGGRGVPLGPPGSLTFPAVRTTIGAWRAARAVRPHGV